MGVFAEKLRALADKDSSKKKYYLTAAPQCPYPDAADKDILNTDSSAAIDAVFVQFYNNYCGVNAYKPARKMHSSRGLYGTPHRAEAQSNFNFDTWDDWALKESKNKDVRVFLGVPANKGAASTGYLPLSRLEPVIEYSKGFESFGGVMMWDVTQAYGNKGFLKGVHNALEGSNATNATNATHGAQDSESSSSSSSSSTPEPAQEEQDESEPADAEQTASGSESEQGKDQPSQSESQAPAEQPSQGEQSPSTENQDAGDDQDDQDNQDKQDKQDEDGQETNQPNLLPSFLRDSADLDFVDI